MPLSFSGTRDPNRHLWCVCVCPLRLFDADVIMATLRGSDGSVLIPCDASGRVLEVALLLDAFWAREK
eukprot:1091683-Pelagomonas_calceolata.AAC.2